MPGLAIETVVAGDAVDRGRGAGDDRDIIRVGEGRHRGVRGAEIAVAAERADGREDPLGDAVVEVFGIAPVDADDHGRALRLAVPPAVELDRLRHRRFSAARTQGDYRGKFSGALASRVR